MSVDRLRQLFLSAAELHQKGDIDAAEAVYKSIHEEFPLNADALHMLGLVAFQRENCHRALGLIQHAIDLNPDNIDYYGTLANVWYALERYRLSAEASKGALRLDPKNPLAALNVAKALWEAHDVDGAVEYSRKAAELDPNLGEVHSFLAVALAQQGDSDGAIAAYRRALSLDPNEPVTHSNLIFAMEQHGAFDQKTIREELTRWDRLHAQPLKHLIKSHPPRDPARQKLRVGWVSPDFRSHVVGRCMLPVFQAFDHQYFQHFCYSSALRPDEHTQLFQQAADGWRDISEMDDDSAADLIRSDAIDLLVDLALHTHRNRLLLFARKPAPVQASYLGYAGSSGLSAIDYRISNPRLDPPDSDLSKYSEKTALLSGSYLCYRPKRALGDISPPPAITNGFVTFGCLNSPEKLSPAALGLFAQILLAVTGSRLILYVDSELFRSNIRSRFARAGIAPERVDFLTGRGWPKYVATYNRIDIALDTFPRGAGITACDALWMGVPIVTLIGDTAVRRMCFSMLYDVGHTQWAAASPEQYVKIAAALAGDIPRLARIRSELRREIESSPLMDARAVARDLERVLKEIALKAN